MKRIYLAYSFKQKKALALITIMFLLTCMVMSLYWFFNDRIRVNTNVLALFPEQVFSSLDVSVQNAMLERLDKQVVFLVKDNGDQQANSAQFLLKSLENLGCFESIIGHIDEQKFNDIGKFYFDNKEVLLDSKTRALLQDQDQLFAYLQANIFASFSGISAQELSHDPLMLTRAVQMNNLADKGPMTIYHNFLATNYQNNTYYLLVGQLRSTGFDIQTGAEIVKNIEHIKSQLYEHFPNSELLVRGTVFYNQSAATLAKHDITYLGLSSITLMLLVMLLSYRSLWPLVLAVFSISCGALVGFTISIWLFDSVHIITLLISMSVIGISADYTIYFCSLAFAMGGANFKEQEQRSLAKVLLVSLITTVISYVLMTLAPFPIIRQICVFAISGLVASCLVVITLYPFVLKLFKQQASSLIGASALEHLLEVFKSNKFKVGYCFIFVLIIAYGLPKMTMDHDIAKLQSLDVALKEQDQKIALITGQSADQNWLVASADDENQLLKIANLAYEHLSVAQEQGKIGSFTKIPIVTKEQQLNNISLVASVYPKVKEFYEDLGMALDNNSPVLNFSQDKIALLSLDDFLKSPASMGFGLMVFKLPDHKMALLIPLSEIKDKHYIKQLSENIEGLHYIDRKSDFDAIFEKCSQLLLLVLALSMVVVTISSIIRNGFKFGLIFLTPSIGAVAMSYASLGILGMQANMFAILASLLVLGISVNYSIFNSYSTKELKVISQWSITMAMMTTIITLGVLVFSSTYAVTVFGSTLLFGIATSFLLSPLANRWNYHDAKD